MLKSCRGLGPASPLAAARCCQPPITSGRQGILPISSYKLLPQHVAFRSIRQKRWQSSETSASGLHQTLVEAINPPSSTLPPPLDLPTKGPDDSLIGYLFRLGRAYGRFYWAGLKLTWSNRTRAQAIRSSFESLRRWAVSKDATLAKLSSSPEDVAKLAIALEGSGKWKEVIAANLQPAEQAFLVSQIASANVTRARFQILVRDHEDWRKLPQMALLVAICGEYLPLLVPFMPGLVPRTCRIPKQIQGMRKTREDRARRSLEAGFEPVSRDNIRGALAKAEDAADKEPVTYLATDAIVDRLNHQQLLHMSNMFALHGRWWARLGFSPPGTLLTRRVKRRLQYLAVDDTLLLRIDDAVDALSDEEVKIACDERAMHVTDREPGELRVALKQWLSNLESADVAAYFEALFDSNRRQDGHKNEKT